MDDNAVVRALHPRGPAEPLPAGTVTFLLADIEGSVRLWEADRSAMTTSIRRLDVLIDELVASHHGVRPVEQGEGDSFVAAFVNASDTIECALEIQRAVANEPWPGGLEIRFRMAVHTGEAQLRDEGNYVGNAINRAGRLRGLAHGGQVLVSPTTFELAADTLPPGTGLRDLGLQSMRDLARPLRIYQLVHPDLRDAFPPLRSLRSLTQHLPVPLSTFVGRERELAEVEAALVGTRLLTLTGSGGCGKTRLAIECVQSVADRYPDGVWFVDLAPVADDDAVPEAFATALQREPETGRPIVDTITEQLAERHALVVVDNCEHVIEAIAVLVESLLARCPGLTVLATSREPLHVTGESAWRVPSMATPGDGLDQPLDTYDSVRLFIDRAVQARSNFKVDNDNAPAVAAICEHLDGIPLAIELAAARLRTLSADEVAEGISDRFRLLRGGMRTALPRQQTLLASVAWSHDLLDDAERTLLRRVSVFRGGFTLDAAEAVVADDDLDRFDVLDLLDRCVDKSLVVMRTDGGASRYRLLESIRDFAAEQLERAGEHDELRARHARWCVAFAADHRDRVYCGPEQQAALERMALELDNVRAALDWALSTQDATTGARLLRSYTWFFNVRCHWHEATRWADEVAALETDDADAQFTATWVAEAMRGMTGELDAALELMPAAGESAREAGNRVVAGWSFNQVYKYSFLAGRQIQIAAIDTAIEIASESGDAPLLADSLTAKAMGILQRGATREAAALTDEAISVAVGAVDNRNLSFSLALRATVGLRLGTLDDAAVDADRAVEAAASLGDGFMLGVGLLVGGDVEMARGNYGQAREMYMAGIEAARETGSPFLNTAGKMLGALAVVEGRPRDALDVFASQRQRGLSLPMWLDSRHARPAAVVDCHALLGDLEAARAAGEDLLESAVEHGNVMTAAHAELALARVHLLAGDTGEAATKGHSALAAFSNAEWMPESLAALECVACCEAARGATADSARLLAAADTLRRGIGSVRSAPEQALVDQAWDQIGAGIDIEVRTTVEAEGRELTLDEAVALARRGRGERNRPAAGWDSLTPAEADVARLVAGGSTNREVADALFVSVNTVKTHLSSVYNKLSISSRTELAAASARRVG